MPVIVIEPCAIGEDSVAPLLLTTYGGSTRRIEPGIVRIGGEVRDRKTAHVPARIFAAIVPPGGNFACVAADNGDALRNPIICAQALNHNPIFRLDAVYPVHAVLSVYIFGAYIMLRRVGFACRFALIGLIVAT